MGFREDLARDIHYAGTANPELLAEFLTGKGYRKVSDTALYAVPSVRQVPSLNEMPYSQVTEVEMGLADRYRMAQQRMRNG